MDWVRQLSRIYGRAAFALTLAVLGVNAIVPAGHMVAPSASHGVTIIPCPGSHPVAAALARQASADAAEQLHDKHHHDGVDHAAMGHIAADSDGDEPEFSAQSSANCSLAAAALAATIADSPVVENLPKRGASNDTSNLQSAPMLVRRFLRPPLRGPPAQA